MSAYDIVKYPRTRHIEGSRLQAGDEDLSQVPFASLVGVELVVEEKCDGANSAVSFDGDGSLLLQSRGHYLTGGAREKHFNLLKQWANSHLDAFLDVLGDRFVMYGEWVYAKHTVFYDRLPHYFLEFDVYDRVTRRFLDTASRRGLLGSLPVVSVPVLAQGTFNVLSELTDLIGPSRYIGEGHMERLRAFCEKAGEDVGRRLQETDPTTWMEGLYVKAERDGEVVDRLKYVRRSFIQCVEESNSHWLSRSIIPNQLMYSLESLFAPVLPVEGGSDE